LDHAVGIIVPRPEQLQFFVDCPAFANELAGENGDVEAELSRMRVKLAKDFASITSSELGHVKSRLETMPKYCRYQFMDHRYIVLDYRFEEMNFFPPYNRRFVRPQSAEDRSARKTARHKMLYAGGKPYYTRAEKDEMTEDYKRIYRETSPSRGRRGPGLHIILHRFLDGCDCRQRSPERAEAYKQATSIIN
jgi:hypothetical protein